MKPIFLSLLIWGLLGGLGLAQSNQDEAYIRAHYSKQEVRIPMRDGVSLFTSIYTPRDTSERYPILYIRTPYRVAPYGPDQYPSRLGPSPLFMREKFIFVYQDVRGRFMSEGVFEDMRPQVPGRNADKKKKIDESTDTWDTIEWLMDSLRHHNERVGMWGISYPGFYTAAGVINSHPNLVCASPQAPIADWWFDDFHHHGAFFLPHCFNFIYSFGKPRRELTTEWPPRIQHGTPDGYDFFLNKLGPLSNAQKDWMGDSIKFWNDLTAHPNYDAFWQARNLLPHLNNVNCAVLTVGGWYDAEDLYGPLNIYQTIEKNNPGTANAIVMGPWRHGGWSRGDGSSLGNVYFGETPAPSPFYQNQIEFPFFMQHLKGRTYPELPEAYMFETGTNQWRSFAQWPPEGLKKQTLYFHEKGRLSGEAPQSSGSYDAFVSDPAKPVPSHEEITTGMPRPYMTADQRFASRRPDVLVYETEVLSEDLTLAGPLMATLKVSTDQADADWVVAL
jgi:putative CocE/NonD family hydrolase